MGHYDYHYASDEVSKVEITDEMVRELEKEVKDKKKVIVYDDFNGVLKTAIARKSKILTYEWNSSRCEITLKK
jgi:hypothetical protein